jgi:hypothetical protein
MGELTPNEIRSQRDSQEVHLRLEPRLLMYRA